LVIVLGAIVIAVTASLIRAAILGPEARELVTDFHTIQPQGPDVYGGPVIADGKHSLHTGWTYLNFGLPLTAIKQTINCGFIVDLSATLEMLGLGQSKGVTTSLEAFIHDAADIVSAEDTDGNVAVGVAGLGDGAGYRNVGTLTQQQLKTLDLEPYKGEAHLGTGINLLPAIQQMYRLLANQSGVEFVNIIVLTEGNLNDLDAIKEWARNAARLIMAGKMLPIKVILVGFGMDHTKLDELDNLDYGQIRGHEVPIDIFDARPASSLEGAMHYLFAEALTQNKENVVASSGWISYNGNGSRIAFPSEDYPAGVPQVVAFQVPIGTPSLVVKLDGVGINDPFEVLL
jgi:hypothetical protein